MLDAVQEGNVYMNEWNFRLNRYYSIRRIAQVQYNDKHLHACTHINTASYDKLAW